MLKRYGQRRKLRLFVLALGAAASGLVLSRAHAHIVPPERLHPVTESYRRMGFLLNLNPVLWPEVGSDATVIADGLEAVAPEKGAAYRSEAVALVERAAEASGGTGPMPADDRKAAARTVFHLSTGAVIDKLKAHLDRSRARLADHGRAALELDEARQLWAAFEPELRYSDEEGFVEIGRCWLELSSALGSAGVLGIGAIEPDREAFDREAGEVLAYLERAYRQATAADSPEPIASVRLGALPERPAFSARPALLPPASAVNKQLPRPRQVLNMATRGVDETETTLIALGDMAFDSPEAFGDPARSLGISCNTCHNKSITNPKFFIPGLSRRPGGLDVSNSFFAPHASNGHFDHVDIPDLRGIRFTGPYGRNGRFASLREFTRNVIVNEFNGPEPDPLLLDGLIAYMFEFDFLPNPALEPDGTLNGAASEAARRGEEIFHRPFDEMNGRSCASCHVPSNHFIDHQRHDVGTVEGAEEASRDRNLETPTLLSAKHTPPYFHDGRAPTLRAAVEHFDVYYGLGLGDEELSDLTAYVETVGDGVEAYEDTVYTLEAELEEFSFFLSAYRLLRARGKSDLIDVTLKTVAYEIQAHKWDVQDPSLMPVLDRMSELAYRASEANRKGEPSETDALIAEYRRIYEENKEVLR